MDLIGTLIDGRYRVTRRLGAGGMGDVYVAHQQALARDVALKVLPDRDATDVDVAERFSREARALSRVQHDNVVVVYDTGVCASTGVHYIAMELLNGETLRARMRRPVDVDEVNAIVAQLLRGLQAVHRVGLVHRDIKPENIMLVDGRVKLVDFGIARRIDGGATLTATGAFVGTPGYAAPERALGDRGDDAGGDLYAVGVIWFELLTRGVLFDGPSALAVAMRHAAEPAPRVSSRVAVDADIDDTIAALLQKTPEARPPLRAVLAVAERQRSTPGTPAATAPPAGTTVAPPARLSTARPSTPPTAVFAITETMPFPAPSSASPWPPSSASSAAAFANPWITAMYDAVTRTLRVQRTERELDVDDVAAAWSWVGAWPVGIDVGAIAAVFDLRGGRAQLSPAFAAAMRDRLLQHLGSFRAAAVVVRSPTVRLQVARLVRELGHAHVEVFHDVDDAARFLDVAAPRP